TMPVETVAPAIVWLASDSCSEMNRIYNVEAGAIQRIAFVMGPGFHDPHLTPESIIENYAKVESIEGFSEPGSVRARSDTRNSDVLRNEVTPWRRSTAARALLHELLRKSSAAAPRRSYTGRRKAGLLKVS